jgi:hypothetical protein
MKPDISDPKYAFKCEVAQRPRPKRLSAHELPLRPRPFYYVSAVEDYVPKPSDPVKVVCFNLHIFQDANGAGNYTADDMARLRQVVRWATDPYEFPALPSDAYPAVVPLQSARIGFKLHRVEFYQSASLFSATGANQSALQAAAVARDPTTLEELNVYITGGHANYSGMATPPTMSPNDDSWVVILGGALPSSDPQALNLDFLHACTLAHEFGHILDLDHTYSVSGMAGNADCTQGPEFLYDVFGAYPSTCPHRGNWAADPFVQEMTPALIAAGADCPNLVITNNLMGGNHLNNWISRLQAGRMHRALTEMSVKRYVARDCGPCACGVAFTVHGYDHVSQGGDVQIAYSHIDLNEGWGFNQNMFVAPFGGIYHFAVSFVKNDFGGMGVDSDVLMTLLNNGAFVARAWSGFGAGQRGTGAVAVNVRLERGDVVTTVAQSVNGTKRNFLEFYFSGHLLNGNCC